MHENYFQLFMMRRLQSRRVLPRQSILWKSSFPCLHSGQM